MTQDAGERRSRWPIAIVIASVLVLIGTFALGVHYSSTSETGGDSSAPTFVDSMDVLISIHDYKYAPAIISVPRGAEVTWVNDDKAPHTATERESAWDTQVLSEGESKTITFDSSDTYNYYCTIHPYMAGSISVRK
jgi:plastocyanin